MDVPELAAPGDAGYYRDVTWLLMVLMLGQGQTSDDDAVALAKDSLSEWLNHSSSEIVVQSIASHRFSPSELLCEEDDAPEQDRTITGHLIHLSVDGTIYEVRVGEGRARVCGSYPARPGASRYQAPVDAGDETPTEASLEDDAESKALILQAREDLAARESLELAEVTLVSFERVMWPDSALGCPKPGLSYLMVLMEGTRIRLQANDVIYQYHSGTQVPPFLCRNPVGRVVPLPRR